MNLTISNMFKALETKRQKLKLEHDRLHDRLVQLVSNLSAEERACDRISIQVIFKALDLLNFLRRVRGCRHVLIFLKQLHKLTKFFNLGTNLWLYIFITVCSQNKVKLN